MIARSKSDRSSAWFARSPFKRDAKSKHFDMNGTLRLPEMIEIEPTQTCNLRCRMCHVSFIPTEKAEFIDVELTKRLRGVKGAYVSIGSGFEPMMHPQFDRLLGGVNELGGPIQLITNGSYCTPHNIAALASSNLYLITFSFDGVRRETYEHIRRRADYESTIAKIRATRQAFRGRDTYFGINSTTLRRNLEETIEAIDFWDREDFDVLRFLIMVVRFPERALLDECLYPVREKARRIFDEAALHVIEQRKKIVIARQFHHGSAVSRQYPQNCDGKWVFSDNPAVRRFPANFRQEYLYGENALVPHRKCHSPFKSATILANGDVQICFKYSVGNLHESDFVDIWYGERADQVRRKLIADAADCNACDCFRFDIALDELDADRLESHFSNELAVHAPSVDFSRGVFGDPIPPPPPRLIKTVPGYNLVYYGGRYIGVPWSAGALELDKTDMGKIDGAFVEDNYSSAVARLRALDGGSAREAGSGETAEAPHLVKVLSGYNLVKFAGRYYGVPWTAGPIEIDKVRIEETDGVFVEPSFEEAMQRFSQMNVTE
jgi:MoaA/NifB/PqqE/SkfB family radical SAM enzyme